MAHSLKFVDSIVSSPTTRLDLSDGSVWQVEADGTSFPPPPLQRAVVDTLLADGAEIPASAYGNRTLRIRLLLKATSADLQATEIQKLARELNRPTNVLRWLPSGATTAVFFRTFRSDVESIIEILSTLRECTVEILAEPFGYGVKQTLSLATVTNDPAAGSNGMYFDVTSVKGDTETPLFLSCAGTDLYADGSATAGKQSVIAVRRRGTPSAMPFVLQAESATMSTNTTVQTTDSAMSGASNNYVRTTFGTATMVTRFSSTGQFPASPSVDARGTYRVFGRFRKSVAGDTITARLVMNYNGGVINGDTVTLPATTLIRWVDLGLWQVPSGAGPDTDGLSATPLTAGGYQVSLQAARTGSGNLDTDCLLWVPADDRLAFVQWSMFSGPSSFVLDSARTVAYALGSSGEVSSETAMPVIGGCPMVSPGETNRIVLMQSVGHTQGISDSKTATVGITPYYWPRYLYVAPATT